MKILVVEDEVKTAQFLEKGITEQGYVVDVVHDGEEGLMLAQNRSYDLIVLDIMMPKLDGWSVISKLRSEGLSTLTLFLTARDSLEDRLRAHELGADAYLVKPFSFAELLANVRTLLRRSGAQGRPFLRVADLEMDLARHAVTRAGQKLDLTPKEFLLLELLLRRKGEVLSRTLIADQVWNMNFDSDTNVVDVHIGRLRSKVDVPFPRRLIHTVRGMGYVLTDEEAT
ncbi:MAG: DNA-binding response regulator [Bdellovibrio sp.]|nr:MAG: DNA-binding response regulator [Bdellovibrio sp.]